MSLDSTKKATNLTKIKGNDISVNSGIKDNGTQRVVLAIDQTVIPISDNGESITVDGTVELGTSTLSALENITVTNDGVFAVQVTSAPSTVVTATDLDIRNLTSTSDSITIVPSGTQTISGTVAIDSVSLAALETISISGTVPVSIASVPTHGVTGTFWQTTQPVSLSSQPLPTGASTETTLSALNTKIPANLTTKAAATAATTSDPSLVVSISPNNTVGVTGTVELGSASLAALETTSITGSVAVTGTFWPTTQPVSIASMPTTTVTGTVSVNALPAGTNAIGKLAANPNVVIGGIEHVPSVNNALTNVNTTAYAASLVAKATAGKIYNIVGYNSKATGQFIQIHNSASLPIAGSVPIIIFYVGPMSNFSLDYGVYGKSFSTGITICNSSTGPTLTVGAADCWFTAEII